MLGSKMSIRFNHALLLGSTTFLSASSISDVAFSQVDLPQVEVQAPSPIRRPPARPAPQPKQAASPAAPAPAAPAAPPTPAAPAAGTLPVVTDQFATVTVVPNEEIRRNGSTTLGDLLFNKPGITGSGFAPGASSRPIIRGLDVNRVGIVENGIGGGGASDLGEDHFVPVDPLSTNQVEVIRGPATLRYGSQSIGGVVSGTNNRIPDALPDCGAAQPGCVTAETRTAVSSVDRGVEGGVLLDAGGGNVAIHADAFGRKAGDYSVPSYPYLFDATKPFNGRQPNSAV